MKVVLKISEVEKLWDPSWGLWHWWSHLLFKFDIVNTLWKNQWRGGRKHYLNSCSCSFLAFSQLNIYWKLELTFFPFSLSKVSSLLTIISNNREKPVIRLVFLYVSTIWSVKYCTKPWHFQLLHSIFTLLLSFTVYLLTCFLLRSLFLIVLHDGVKNIHVREA